MSMKMMSWAGRKILERTLKLSNHPSSQCLRKITSNSVLYTASNNKKELSSDDVVSFKAMLPELINELTYDGIHKDMPNVNPYLAQCIQYNLTNGKLNRGSTVPLTLKLLSKNDISRDKLREAFILGWCIEFLQAFFSCC